MLQPPSQKPSSIATLGKCILTTGLCIRCIRSIRRRVNKQTEELSGMCGPFEEVIFRRGQKRWLGPKRWLDMSKVLLAASLLLAPMAAHTEPETTAALIEAARSALRRDDGIDAEVKLRNALSHGVPRDQIAAYMGGAFFRQGDLVRARQWLGQGQFSPETAAEGFRVLAALEQQEGHLVAAGKAYDRALAITPDDAGLWVEIGRLRYRGGQHLLAIDAAEHALGLAPSNVRALEFRGELMRDQYGLLAGIKWFETALVHAPQDVSVLMQYAATLGELGRGTEMVAVTRRLLEMSPGNPKAYYLQSVLAARAGDYEVARRLLAKTNGKFDNTPGAILLGAVLELSAGNTQTASELCEKLLEKHPDTIAAKQLLARALYRGGQYHYLTLRFRDDIARKDVSPYLLTVIARGFEAIGERMRAGELLDRANLPQDAALRVVHDANRIGELMAQGRSGEAIAATRHDLTAAPGSYDSQSLAGDLQLALGHAAKAQQHYLEASRIRMTDSLLQRRFEAYSTVDDFQGAAQMVADILAQNPGNRTALRLQALLSLRAGDPLRAGAVLEYLRATGSDDDVQLLADLALIRVGTGAPQMAQGVAEHAYHLQRSSPIAAQALALHYAALGVRRPDALSLLDKARQMLGDNALIADARQRLAERPQS